VNIVTYPKLPYEQLERRSRCPWCDQISVVPLDDEEVVVLAAKQVPWTDKCDPERGGKCIKAGGKPGVRRFQQDTGAWPEWVWVGETPKYPVQLIVDEAHYCKNKGAQRTIATRTIAAACASGPEGRSSSVWLLTGTPLLNEPPELWSLCQLFPGATGKFDDGAWDAFGSWSAFVEMFGGKKQVVGGISRGYEWNGTAKPEARECLGTVMLRRMREDVLPDLPKKTRRYIDVSISKQALSKDAMLTENLMLLFREWSDDKVLAECAVGGALSKLRKELANLKLPTLLKFVKEYEENAEPVVVFSYHRDPIIALGERKDWACITGSTGAGERSALVEKFQKGVLKGLAGTIGAMGVGVTLTRAANMLFLDRDFVPANNLQAEDRLVRIGQDRGVCITILSALHPIDERVAIILEKKEMLLEAMDLAEEHNTNLDPKNGPLFEQKELRT
jgi:SNF2 family DNA or RNA helicase